VAEEENIINEMKINEREEKAGVKKKMANGEEAA